MKLSLKKVDSLCRRRGIPVAQMLRDAGVSRNAFYTLARKNFVVPQSLIRISDVLEVSVSQLLDDVMTPRHRMKRILSELNGIVKRHPRVDCDNVRHTLLLLDDKPIERLRRALQRGRRLNFR